MWEVQESLLLRCEMPGSKQLGEGHNDSVM